MTTTAKVGPQDLPPKNGYAPFQIERIKLRTLIGGRLCAALFFASTFGGLYMYSLNYKEVAKNKIEMRSSRLALKPMLEAERDRALLKLCGRIREEEADLMKNVPGWEVGTLFGQPIYHTLPEDEYDEPTFRELTIHGNPDRCILDAYHHLIV